MFSGRTVSTTFVFAAVLGASCSGKVSTSPPAPGGGVTGRNDALDAGASSSSAGSSGGGLATSGSSGSTTPTGSSGGNSGASGSGVVSSSAPNGGTSSGATASASSSGAAASSGSSGGPTPVGDSGGPVLAHRARPVDKVDLLFMIDNSASMGDKQALLVQAIPDMITRLVTPNCVDVAGTILGQADPTHGCALGSPEFPPVHDMHIGIVTSSLGGRGTQECLPTEMNPAMPGLNAHNDDRGELVNRSGDAMETPVALASPFNFLAWFPSNAPANVGTTTPVGTAAEQTVGAPGQAGTLVGDFTNMVSGVHEHGCGFEATNEAWYRFLVQPDPFDHIALGGTFASEDGVDATILAQRAAFLRPDSLLAVIVVTDENEEVANPLSVGGQGWLFEGVWPGGTAAPEGTIECTTIGPNDPNCTSCAFSSVQSTPGLSSRCPSDPPGGIQGHLDPSDDSINVRFFDQKKRFGVFVGYPTTRYTRGLMSPTVPDRFHEVDALGDYIGDQDQYANCVNPIFAQNLPTDGAFVGTSGLCNLERGPRTQDLVFYAAIAGVPHELLQSSPGDVECAPGTSPADCPQKSVLSDSEWTKITGADPDHYDFTGADPHMVESEVARTSLGLNCDPAKADNCDPISGREWDTKKSDLQFACTFPLVDPTTGAPRPKDCTLPQYTGACDCFDGTLANPFSKPICAKDATGQYTAIQIYGKAYPSVREMTIARKMATSPAGVQGVVSSLCPIHASQTGGANDPLFGYRPAVRVIVDRLKPVLAASALLPH